MSSHSTQSQRQGDFNGDQSAANPVSPASNSGVRTQVLVRIRSRPPCSVSGNHPEQNAVSEGNGERENKNPPVGVCRAQARNVHWQDDRQSSPGNDRKNVASQSPKHRQHTALSQQLPNNA